MKGRELVMPWLVFLRNDYFWAGCKESQFYSLPFMEAVASIYRTVKTFFNSRLIMNSRRLWNSHQRHTFLRAEASRDIVKFRISEIASPGVFNRYFPPRTPCCFVGIHARLEAMPSKCPRRSTTSHGSNVSQVWSCLNMRSMSFKTGKRMLHNFIRWCLFFLAVMTHLW